MTPVLTFRGENSVTLTETCHELNLTKNHARQHARQTASAVSLTADFMGGSTNNTCAPCIVEQFSFSVAGRGGCRGLVQQVV